MKIFNKEDKPKGKESATLPSTTESMSGSEAGGTGRYIVKSPLLTEKAARGESGDNKYVFLVHEKANKSEIKKEIERLFKVGVENVNIVNQPRKRKTFRGHEGFRSGSKKAIVTVEKGKKIEILPT